GRQSSLRTRIPVLYHKGLARILGLDIGIWGDRSGVTPTLYVVNHSSWLDIVVLSCVIPGSFVAKAEVKDWPFFGTLARLQRSVFIDRRPNQVANHRDEIGTRLDAGDNLILFPEGTSSDGNRVLRFKSALFAVAERTVDGRSLPIQPVTVAYTHLDAIPLGRHLRPLLTWYGDMCLGSHLWRVLRIRRTTVAVVFHPVLAFGTADTRKGIAERSRVAVTTGLSDALSGRLPLQEAGSTPNRSSATVC
ncbi:MAG: 1-acyl-sn-glycerol-3-phosphate acyltransferase, partial [Alphaproteobacteria bacterium]|nr:1-acyl-sn-glycerol-3-phosphate acyltransferase [Alphaproteobacteria bacterium]